MSSKKELVKLEDENRTLCQRLSDVEVELARKEDALKSANQRKSELLNDLRDYQRKLKDTKAQLERTECAELEAKGQCHDNQLALEQAEANLRDKTASSKAAIGKLQLEIKSLKSKLAEMEERYDGTMEKLHYKEELMESMNLQRTKTDKEGSSRVANLNQALMQAKQVCAQLTEENEGLQHKGYELQQKFDSLQQECSRLSKERLSPCKVCLDRDMQQRGNGNRTPLRKPPSTPAKPIPGESELDSLQIENKKLKQELSCLQTNFQLLSHKASETRKEKTDLEASVAELQSLFDMTLGEKEELEQKLETLEGNLKNKTSSMLSDREKNVRLTKQVDTQQDELDSLQQQNLDLQDKLKAELNHSLESQDIIEKLDAQSKILKEQKLSIEGELSSLQKKLVELQDDFFAANQSHGLHSEIQRKSSEAVGALERKVSLITSEKNTLAEELNQASESLEKAHTQIRTLEEAQGALKAKLAAKVAKNSSLMRETQQQSHLPSEIESLQEKLSQLSDEMSDITRCKEELEEKQRKSEARIKDLDRANSLLRREASHSKDMAKKMQKEIEKQESCSSDLEDQLRKKKYECSSLARENEELTVEVVGASNAKDKYEAEVEKLLSRLEEVEQCNFELTSKLSDIQSERNAAMEAQEDAQLKLSELEKELQAAEFSLLEKESLISDVKCTNELMEGENTTLLSQVTSLSEMVATRNSKVESLQSQLMRYESETLDIVEKIADLESSHGQCAVVIDDLKQKISTLEEYLDDALTENKTCETTILSLKLEIKQLQEYNSGLETINGDLQAKLKTCIAKEEDLASKYRMTDLHMQDLKQELNLKAAALKSSMDEVDFTKKSSEETQAILRNEIESLEFRCGDLEKDCGELRRTEIGLKSEVMQLQVEVKEQTRLSSVLRSERDDLSDQYEKLKESALSMLDDSSSNAIVFSSEEENRCSISHVPANKKKLKGILKNSGTHDNVLKPVQNLID